MVEKGLNSDLIYRGLNFHVQTEDWGQENPYVVSRVFQEGAVVQSVKTSYREILGNGRNGRYLYNAQLIREALERQHNKILDLLISGQLF